MCTVISHSILQMLLLIAMFSLYLQASFMPTAGELSLDQTEHKKEKGIQCPEEN